MFLPNYTVLIIDDDVTTIKLMAESLRAEFEVIFATTAADGLKSASGSPAPDVILLDVMMPEMDGYQVCKRLKQNPLTQDIPVIFVSALKQTTEQQRGFEMGAIDYVVKPIEAPLLMARTRTHARMHQYVMQLENLAATDPLTSCANRRKFDEVLEIECRRGVRTKEPLAILMLDIDNFKAYNDNYGHGKGDECLVKLSKIMRSVAKRPGDLVARLGGEEFAFILPNTDDAGVKEIAKQITMKLEQSNISHAYSAVADIVTVSMGYDVCYLNTAFDIKKLLDKIDQALFKAKHAGKNQVQPV